MLTNKRIVGIYLGVLVALIYGVMSGERRHSLNLRDSHEYIHKQVWGEQIYTGQSLKRFDLVEEADRSFV